MWLVTVPSGFLLYTLSWHRGCREPCQLSRVGWLQLVEQSQDSEAIPLGSQHVLQGSYVSLIVSAPSSVCMSQMLGCASRGWEHGQKQVLWEPGPVAGRGIRTGKGTGEWEEAEAECHGAWSTRGAWWELHSGFCLQQLWRLTAGDIGPDRRRHLIGWRDTCSCSRLLSFHLLDTGRALYSEVCEVGRTNICSVRRGRGHYVFSPGPFCSHFSDKETDSGGR